MSALTTSQNASCHRIPLLPSCTLHRRSNNKGRRSQTDGDKAGNVRVDSSPVTGGSDRCTNEGLVGSNAAAFFLHETLTKRRVCSCLGAWRLLMLTRTGWDKRQNLEETLRRKHSTKKPPPNISVSEKIKGLKKKRKLQPHEKLITFF